MVERARVDDRHLPPLCTGQRERNEMRVCFVAISWCGEVRCKPGAKVIALWPCLDNVECFQQFSACSRMTCVRVCARVQRWGTRELERCATGPSNVYETKSVNKVGVYTSCKLSMESRSLTFNQQDPCRDHYNDLDGTALETLCTECWRVCLQSWSTMKLLMQIPVTITTNNKIIR